MCRKKSNDDDDDDGEGDDGAGAEADSKPEGVKRNSEPIAKRWMANQQASTYASGCQTALNWGGVGGEGGAAWREANPSLDFLCGLGQQ